MKDPQDGPPLDLWLQGLADQAAADGMPVDTHRYGDSTEQVADLRLPSTPGPHPVVVMFHGGAFRKKYRRDHVGPLCIDLTRRGFATWNVEYRRSDCGGGPGATTDDIATALTYLRSLDSPLDLSSITTIGHSSGGYFSLWAAALPPVTLAIGLAPVCDLATTGREASGGTALFMGSTSVESPELYEDMDLLRLAPSRATRVVLHGTDDPLSIQGSRDYVTRANQLGHDVTLHELSGVGHYAFLDPSTDAWRHVIQELPTLIQ